MVEVIKTGDVGLLTGKVAVLGATGRVGRHVVDVLRERGVEVVPMSRASGVDVVTGQGLRDGLAGVDSVVDAASGPSPEEGPATEFFTRATGNDKALGVFLILRNPSPSTKCYADFTLTLLNREHFSRNEQHREKQCKFTADHTTQVGQKAGGEVLVCDQHCV